MSAQDSEKAVQLLIPPSPFAEVAMPNGRDRLLAGAAASEDSWRTNRYRVWRDVGVWLTFAAFAPYLSKSLGIRTEHVLIYAVGSLGLLRLLTSRVRRPTYIVPVVAFFGIAVIWALFVTFMSTSNDADTLRVIADADHYLRPLCIVIGLIAWIEADYHTASVVSLERICKLLLVLLGINAFLVAVSLFVDVGWFFQPFRPENISSQNVADLAAELGRFTGVFNLPFEAGVAYSLGLFAWAYLYLGEGASKPYAFAHLGLALLVVGGLMPVSKAFLLGGLPLFLIYWVASGGLGKAVGIRAWPILAIAIIAITIVLPSWLGTDFLVGQYQKVISGDSGLVSSLSAGRFGESGMVSGPFLKTAAEAPLTGFGLGMVRILDSAYLLFFVHGGTVPLFGYVVLLGWVITRGLQYAASSREGRILTLIGVYMVGAGLGAPVASVVRASTVLWVMVSLLLIGIAGSQRDQGHRLRF